MKLDIKDAVSGFRAFVLRITGTTAMVQAYLDTVATRNVQIHEVVTGTIDAALANLRAMQERLDAVYEQRNLLAIALAQLVPGSGVSLDNQKRKGWDAVVTLRLQGGPVSFHMSPEQALPALSHLRTYDGPWDGAGWTEHARVLYGFIEAMGDDLLGRR